MAFKTVNFMSLPYANGNKSQCLLRNPSHELLEPIQHNDEQTIHRLISIHHTRSYSNGQHTDTEQHELFKAISAQYTDDDDDDSSNDGSDSDNYYQNDDEKHKTSLSITQFDDECTANLFEKSLRTLSPKTETISLNISIDPKHSINTISLRRHSKPKIKRQKTPTPFSKRKSLKIDCSDERISNNKSCQKQLKFKSVSGHLEKKSASKFIGWQRRWFYLWKDTLDYYKESSLHRRGSISLYNIEYVGVTNEYNMNISNNKDPSIQKNKYHKANKYTFQIQMKTNIKNNVANAGRTYYIRSTNIEQRDEWIKILKNNIKCLEKRNLSLSNNRDRNSSYSKSRERRSRSIDLNRCKSGATKRSKSSYRNRNRDRNRHKSVPFDGGRTGDDHDDIDNLMISFGDICEYSNTGDILLFHTKSSSGAIVRAATGGNYDHIGMIFRLKNGKVGILEALGSGVQVFLWTNFRKYDWHKQYTKIGFRSLIIPDVELRKEMKRKLALFVRTVVNRNYGWNPIQLIRKESTMDLYDESRTFFCSELVAKAFKEVGLLRNDFASSQYFPSHFQENKGLKLLKGCSFSKEMEVVCTSNDIQQNKSLKCEAVDKENVIEIVSLNGTKSNESKQRLTSPPPPQSHLIMNE